MKFLIILWILMGLVGYILRCKNKDVCPKNIKQYCFIFLTHVLFGPLGFLYGYICYTNQEKIKEVKN